MNARLRATQGNLDRHFGADEHIPDSDLANLGGEVADHHGRVSPPRDTARQTVVAISGRCLRVGLWGQLGHPFSADVSTSETKRQVHSTQQAGEYAKLLLQSSSGFFGGTCKNRFIGV